MNLYPRDLKTYVSTQKPVSVYTSFIPNEENNPRPGCNYDCLRWVNDEISHAITMEYPTIKRKNKCKNN